MTAEEKTSLARFLDLSGDYLNGGYARPRGAYAFMDDNETAPPEPPVEGGLSSLPLAYQVGEDEDAAPWYDDAAQEPAAGVMMPAAGAMMPTAGVMEPTTAGIAALSRSIHDCKACGLAAARTKPVPGEGAARPLVMVIGEGPGADEDAAGRPFVGKAGQLLDKMLSSIGLFRERNCYIANVVKCRPPANRDPEPEEIAACFPFLEQQIALLRPRLILCAGRVAAQSLLKTNRGIHALRSDALNGEFAGYKPALREGETGGEGGEAIPVLCTFHPSAVLRDESLKRPAWEDLKLLRLKLGL